MSTMYSHEFIVEGFLLFPSDMLRYDHCYPIDAESAYQISAGYSDIRGLKMEEKKARGKARLRRE